MIHNLIKERLNKHLPAIGVALPFAAPQLVELIGYAGFHWVLIDCEHGPMNLETVEVMIRAAEWAGITPVIRPCRNEPEEILHYLDMGAHGIYVPKIETRADAEAAAECARYYPQGNRGLAQYARWARAGREGPMPKLMINANNNILVFALIESVKGVENIDEITKVPGIDVIAVGPADLSQSMRLPGEITHPEVLKAVEHVLDHAIKAGKHPSFGAATPDDAKKWISRDVLCLTIGAQALIVGGGRNFLKNADIA
jgi:4-hydroxy-2-oxoheptanedioate aldolase